MAQGSRLVDLVQTRIDGFLDDRSTILRSIAPELEPLDDFSRRFLSGGKRFRALFCYWGWESVGGSGFDPFGDDAERDTFPIVSAASALEVFHAAALVHDDIIDNSDTRRGAPAAHRLFERMHADAGWLRSSDEFGRASAILLGDLLLGWSDELLDEGLDTLSDRAAARAARAEFMRMRTEVTAGQYLDILAEQSWRTKPDDEQRQIAERVITYKAAKYSVESPLALGGLIAGGTPAQIRSLRDFGLPLGMAYQLRDDLLGVYGDPAVTGKPSGDDLREGKRTMLVAIARERLAAGPRNLLDELLGDPELTDEQIRMLQRTIGDSGAVDEVETIIAAEVGRALAALADAPLSSPARSELAALATTVSRRSS
ncbi:polyprenyl synthetase family protein [Agromyces aureus]|uniref:Geranylgeranyl pyrophosphate synthase n=1 Tax=Agromyces aureus TaxID=453304 RepID=A0A191WG51_9MICO|nr:polyprenyl synthetase family protein [Agromyces aureus]ANJ27270.1 geranylgeranyl pyrophosphate synthase [Agromyces aureus]